MDFSIYLYLFALNFSSSLLACPTCGGTGDTKKDSIVVGLLALFILGTYGVYYILFKIIYRYRNYNIYDPNLENHLPSKIKSGIKK